MRIKKGYKARRRRVRVWEERKVWRRRDRDKGIEEGGREREVGNRWRKMWQRRVIEERIERVQLHLMEGKRGVIAREGREKETQHIFWCINFCRATKERVDGAMQWMTATKQIPSAGMLKLICACHYNNFLSLTTTIIEVFFFFFFFSVRISVKCFRCERNRLKKWKSFYWKCYWHC